MEAVIQGVTMITRYIIQHPMGDLQRLVDDPEFTNALDTYIVISKCGVFWPCYKYRSIERCIIGEDTYTETVLSIHK